jgi:membrane associated rhomboid family serine protease
MVQASVGFQCPECAGARRTRVVSGPAAFRSASDPVVTKVLIGINVAFYLLMVARGGDAMDAAGPVFEWGATFGPFVASGEWYRLVTGAFLHAGVLHLAMNMYLLWLLGRVLEPALGRARFGLLYAASLLGGALGVMVMTPEAATVGASGAVFGLMGAMVVLQYRAGQNPWQSGILGLVALNLVITFVVPGISIGGHLGGLLTGGVAALGMTVGAPSRPVPTIAHVTGLLVLCGVLATGAVLAVA